MFVGLKSLAALRAPVSLSFMGGERSGVGRIHEETILMGAALVADGAGAMRPQVLCFATDLANAPLPVMIGVPVHSATAASAILPIVVLIPGLAASLTKATLPVMF